MTFARDVIVVAIHRFLPECKLRQPDFRMTKRIEKPHHHQIAVHLRITLRPTDGFDVFVERICVFREVSKIAVGQTDAERFDLFTRALDEERPDPVTDSTRTGVQNKPHVAFCIDCNFAKMIAGPKSRKLLRCALRIDFRVFCNDRFVLFRELRPCALD